MEKIKNYVIIALFVIVAILLSLRQCNTPNIGKNASGGLKIDTVTKTRIIDRPYEVIKTKTVYKPKYDTIYELPKDYNIDSLAFTRVYKDSIADTNQTIHYNAKVSGVLEKLDLSYRLKVPKTIETTHEYHYHHHDTTYISNKWSIIGIGGIGGNKTQFNVTAGLAVRYKKAYYGYEYNPIDKTHNAKIGIVLFNSKK